MYARATDSASAYGGQHFVKGKEIQGGNYGTNIPWNLGAIESVLLEKTYAQNSPVLAYVYLEVAIWDDDPAPNPDDNFGGPKTILLRPYELLLTTATQHTYTKTAEVCSTPTTTTAWSSSTRCPCPAPSTRRPTHDVRLVASTVPEPRLAPPLPNPLRQPTFPTHLV